MTAFMVLDTFPRSPVPEGVPNDGAQLPWLGAILTRDFFLNKAQGLPVTAIQPMWDHDHTSLPNWWPLNGEMQGE